MRPILVLALLAGACARPPDTLDALAREYPFSEIATTRFQPVYPAMARQLVQDSGLTRGVCVDVGGGAGWLAQAIARVSDLTVYVLDIDPTAVALGTLLAREAGLADRVRPVQGDATDMPFRDGFADLVVSRGSIFFWEDQLAGVLEVYRILAPGGVAYLGGGFSRVLAEEDPATYAELVRWRNTSAQPESQGWRPLEPGLEDRARAAGVAGIRRYRDEEVGVWLEIRKPPAP